MEIQAASGRTIKTLTVVTDPSYNSVEIKFADGLEIWIEIMPALKVQAELVNMSTGDAKPIRKYRALFSVAGDLK